MQDGGIFKIELQKLYSIIHSFSHSLTHSLIQSFFHSKLNHSNLKILLTGANNAKALKLIKAFPNHFILLADYGDVPVITTGNYAFSSIGVLNKESIAHILLNYYITEAVDSIIPLHQFEVEPLARAGVLFEEYGIQVLTPPADKIVDFLYPDKNTFQNFAVFIKGECVFASSNDIFIKHDEEFNGVFGYNLPTDELKLFTI